MPVICHNALRASAFCILLALQPARAEIWKFRTPPTAERVFTVDADWRQHDGIAFDARIVSATETGSLHCVFFFQTKQNVWFETWKSLDLSHKKRTFQFRLDDASPDWLSRDARRPFGRDAVRWIRAWGIKVSSESQASGEIEFSMPRFIPAAQRVVAVDEILLPEDAVAGRKTRVRVRLTGFDGNPFDSTQIECRLACDDGSERRSAAFYFRQEYRSIIRPGSDAPEYVALERPVWQADWIPAREGEHKLTFHLRACGKRQTVELGKVIVGPPSGDKQALKPDAAGPDPIEGGFVGTNDAVRNVEFVDGKWRVAEPDGNGGEYWAVPLDWTPKWGRYTGSGEFDQFIAWQFEQELLRTPTNISRPILIFSEDELDNSGKFNWADHPLSSKNGGPLARPSDVFGENTARRVILDRARYIWSRYGGMPCVSGLIILSSRRERSVTDWLNGIAVEFEQKADGWTPARPSGPDPRLSCSNEELLERSKVSRLDFYGKWSNDTALAQNTVVHILRNGEEAVVQGTYPGASAIVSRQVQHLAGIDALACEILVPPAKGDPFKAMCSLRVDRNTVFQSKLVELRPEEMNRVLFHLSSDAWTCFRDPARRLDADDLLNVSEVALRFFCNTPEDGALRMVDFFALGPFKVDMQNRPHLAISGLKGNSDEVSQYGKMELEFNLNRTFHNPYDPREIDVMVEWTDPAGKKFSHPGYYHESWSLDMVNGRETAVKSDADTSWRVRFTPSMPGKHEWKVVARAEAETAEAGGSFVCVAGKSRGFVRVATSDPKYFEFSDGTLYLPIGFNVRSPSDRRSQKLGSNLYENLDWADANGTRAYEKWFGLMRENKANFARVWMCPWWCGLEWRQEYEGYHGIGYYNQGNAARLDRIVELAEKEGVYLNLETINHGCLSTMVDGDWVNNPHNRVESPGGYVNHATEFFSDKRCQESHINKMRYTTARWGYSTAIAWWGTMTEAEWAEPYTRGLHWVGNRGAREPAWVPHPYKTTRYMPAYLDWLSSMGGQIRKMDGHPHLVSAHFSNPWNGKELWDRPNTDVVYNNAYTSFVDIWEQHRFRSSRGVADVIFVFADTYQPYCAAKPLLIGEWGGTPAADGNSRQQLAVELHTGIWATAMTTAAGVTGYWWWNLIDADGMYDRFKALAAFMKDEDPRGKGYRSSRARLAFPEIKGRSDTAHRAGLVRSNEKELFAYIYTREINRYEDSRSPDGFDDKSFRESGKGHLRPPSEFGNGAYTVEYWNTFTGQIVGTANIVVSESSRRIPIMSHHVDIALKVKPDLK